MATEMTLDSLHREHQLWTGHRCSCGWEGDSATTHIIDAITSAGFLFYKDEGKHCPRCGAPDPDGYTDEEMGG